MPVHHNNNLDDPLVFDVQSNFSRGQVSNARANLLDEQQGALLRNIVLDYNGVLESRRGFRDFGAVNLSTATTSVTGSGLQGLYYHDTLSTEWLVAAASGNLYYYNNATTGWTSLSAATAFLATTGDVWFTQVADKLYFTSGTGNIAEWDGEEIEADVSTSATGLRYLVSHGFRVFGAANIDELWCSYVLPDAGSDFLEDEDGNILRDENNNRITGDYKTFFGSNATFRVGTGDGDKITALVPWSDFNLLVFKEQSTYAVNTNPAIVTTAESTGTDVAEFIVRTVSTRIGCVSHKSAVQIDNDCLFLASDGVRSVVRTIQDGTQGVSPALSYPINDIIRRINWDRASVACATFWNGKYILAIPVDNSTTNNMMIVYDKNLNAWYWWDGITPIQFCITRFGGSPQKLVVLENTGNVLELRDWFTYQQADGTDYSDVLAAGDQVESPANVTHSIEELSTSREGASWWYRVSFHSDYGNSAVSNAISFDHIPGNPNYTAGLVPFIDFDVPSESGLTAKVWRYVATVGTDELDPGPSLFTLWTSFSADLGQSESDQQTPAEALFEQSSYTGERPPEAANGSALVEVRPTWRVRTRAFTFSDPVSPKKPNHVEVEFDKSHATVDLAIFVDGQRQSPYIGQKIVTGAGLVSLPVTLPFTLGDNKVVRKRFNTDLFDPGREIQFELTEAANLSDAEQANSEYLRVREINASAYLETMEDQE